MTLRPPAGLVPARRRPMPFESLAPETVGYVAAGLTTVSFVPQALLTLRTRRADGVSLPMYALFTAGVALWLVYGVLLGAWPIIAANAITLALASTILGAAWRSRRRRDADRDR